MSALTNTEAAEILRQESEGCDCIRCKALRMAEAALRAQGEARLLSMLKAQMHYPECWDTACYPTFADALHEALQGAGCSTCGIKLNLRAEASKAEPSVAGAGWYIPDPAKSAEHARGVPEGWKLVPDTWHKASHPDGIEVAPKKPDATGPVLPEPMYFAVSDCDTRPRLMHYESEVHRHLKDLSAMGGREVPWEGNVRGLYPEDVVRKLIAEAALSHPKGEEHGG
jgi:hypothetical protein